MNNIEPKKEVKEILDITFNKKHNRKIVGISKVYLSIASVLIICFSLNFYSQRSNHNEANRFAKIEHNKNIKNTLLNLGRIENKPSNIIPKFNKILINTKYN